MGIQSKNWSLVLINGFNQHLQKGVLQFNTSPVEDPKLSLVRQLYLNLCFLILTLSFVLGFDRLFTLTLPLWYTNSSYFLHFYLIYTTPTSQPPCVSFYRRFVPVKMASTNSFSSPEENKRNHKTNGINTQTGPFKGQSPFVPQPLGSSGAPISHTLFIPPPISHLPPPPGLPSPPPC